MKFSATHLHTFVLILCCSRIASGVALANELGNTPPRERSTGCGIARTGTGNFRTVKIPILDQDRIYHLRVPSTYDPKRAYPLIFRWHGTGGNGLSGGLDIELSSGNDAIIVGADGLNKSWYGNSTASDLLLFDRMLDTIEKQYCIDRGRIFSYGFSAGGYFSNLLACERGDVLRASAAIASGPRGTHCKGQVAHWLLHDADDRAVPIAKGKAARDRAISMNNCSAASINEGDGCTLYQGCTEAPVIWCESKGFGHNIRNEFATPRVWNFFLNLR